MISMASKNHLSSILFTLFCILQLHPSTGQSAVKGGYWFPDSGIQASGIDSTLFTHLFCAFAQLDSNNELVITSANEAQFSSFTSTVQQKNPSVITLLSIGGGSDASDVFNSMASQASSRKSFIDSSIKLARDNGFHGLDLDWEHQTTSAEMDNLALLLDEWRTAVKNEASSTGAEALILTAAVAYAPQVNPETIYPVQSIARNLDWINVMAYDFYAPNRSNVTRSHSALFDPSSSVSASAGIKAWIDAGVPSKNIVLGVPFYGYAWKLVDPNNHGLLAPADGIDSSVGNPVDGSMQYNQIKEFISGNNAATVFDSTYVTNYCYSGTTWIGYDDTPTISAKAAYAKNNGLLGYFAWHVAADDNWSLSQQAFQAWGA